MGKLENCKNEEEEQPVFGAHMLEDEKMLTDSLFPKKDKAEKERTLEEVAVLISSCDVAPMAMYSDKQKVLDIIKQGDDKLANLDKFTNENVVEAARVVIKHKLGQQDG